MEQLMQYRNNKSLQPVCAKEYFYFLGLCHYANQGTGQIYGKTFLNTSWNPNKEEMLMHGMFISGRRIKGLVKILGESEASEPREHMYHQSHISQYA